MDGARPSQRSRWCAMVWCAVAACGPGPVGSPADDGTSDGGSTHASEEPTDGVTSAATSPGMTSTDGTTSLPADEGSSSGPPSPRCGDGIVDPDERCDGPSPDGLPCSDDCQYPAWTCDGLLHECGNTLDDDGDGLVDMDDPDCLSPCDDDELRLDPNQVGDSADPSQSDCYWDGDNGQGNDGCRWDTRCDPLEPGGPFYPYNPNLFVCMNPQIPECIEACVPLTPNGCDCFGCCEVGATTIYLGFPTGSWDDDRCTAATPELCHPCTINQECFNPCDAEECELCFLQSVDRLAPGCTMPACDPGVTSCISSYECPPDTVCKTGCCLAYEL